MGRTAFIGSGIMFEILVIEWNKLVTFNAVIA
jgi:hypothetical protein